MQRRRAAADEYSSSSCAMSSSSDEEEQTYSRVHDYMVMIGSPVDSISPPFTTDYVEKGMQYGLTRASSIAFKQDFAMDWVQFSTFFTHFLLHFSLVHTYRTTTPCYPK